MIFQGDTTSKRHDKSMPTNQEKSMEIDTEKYKIPEGTPKTAIVVGAGARGHGYSFYAKYYPDQFKVMVIPYL